MENNKQQTAVDFAFETLANQGLLVYKEYTNLVAYQEAKEMEKEQILDAYECGFESEHDARIPQSSMRYYNETYEGGEQ